MSSEGDRRLKTHLNGIYEGKINLHGPGLCTDDGLGRGDHHIRDIHINERFFRCSEKPIGEAVDMYKNAPTKILEMRVMSTLPRG